MDKYQEFNGIRYCLDERTGYYRHIVNGAGKLLHRAVWEYHNGTIPDGCEIHHIDQDKSNNSIENLQLLTTNEHRKLHAKKLTENEREWRRKHMIETVIPKAAEWHKSEEGKKWHKEQFKKYGKALHEIQQFKCKNCGKEFMGDYGSKFCSNACKSAYRRKTGADLITKSCEVCGAEFKTNKFRPSRTCSRSCANRLRSLNK